MAERTRPQEVQIEKKNKNDSALLWTDTIKETRVAQEQVQEQLSNNNLVISVKDNKGTRKKQKIYYLTEESINKVKRIAKTTGRNENEVIELMIKATKILGEK
ncbi:MAG: hypothetical protein LBC44_00430 [Mycoplasmataceae bacterium]|jgi:hypothetical protein|nr:hypothetical protein [Mycoplasmataceae bacterium]